ncbi:MAG: aspartate aminotransferase family protein [Candidatus Omnitrophota bacterium]
MSKDQVFADYQKYILNTYTRTPVIFVKGKGSKLVDIHGKTYLDFFPGWGVNNVGHCHPKVMAGVRDQVGKLIHIPNNLYHPPQAKLAREIIRNAFPGKVFFCNSGAEAAEAAIKFARACGKGRRYEIITMTNSFHGRTLGALAATGQEKYQKGFEPLPEGFCHVPFNDLEAVREAVTDRTAAVMLEPVQGEGGVHVADQKYLKGLRALCDEHDLLLIFDEVQTGLGRTGEMFAFQHYGVRPDVMTLAKALGGGLPIGAMIAAERFADVFKPGMHASTFAGSPLVCKAALGVFKAIHSGGLLKNARTMSDYALKRFAKWQAKFPFIREVRGLGLMLGLELSMPGAPVVEFCFEQGLLINCTQGNILRIMPALTVTRKEMDRALAIMEQALEANAEKQYET